MQTLESLYDREPLTVADEIPTSALRHLLGSKHVRTPDAVIERWVRGKIAKSGVDYTPQQIEQTIQAALWIHHENLAEYKWVMKV